MANWANIAYGAERGLDDFQKTRNENQAAQAAAEMFRQIGTKEAGGYADLLASNPATARILSQQWGGPMNYYRVLQQNAQVQVATRANQAAGQMLGPEYAQAASQGADPIALAEASAKIDNLRNPTQKGVWTGTPEQEVARQKILSQLGTDKPTGEDLSWAMDEAHKVGLPISVVLRDLKGRPAGPDAGGTATPQATTVIASNLRGEFQNISTDFRKMHDAYLKVEDAATDDTAQGDMATIFGFMKILDPGSTVREGEYATAENARGVPDTIRNQWNKLVAGERLAPGQREQFAKTAKRQFVTAAKTQSEHEREYERLARSSGVPSDQVVVDYLGRTRDLLGVGVADSAIPSEFPPGTTLHSVDENGKRTFALPNGKYAVER